METREERGLQIAALTKIERTRLGRKVPSQSNNSTSVGAVERGERNIALVNIRRLADALGCPLSDLLSPKRPL